MALFLIFIRSKIHILRHSLSVSGPILEVNVKCNKFTVVNSTSVATTQARILIFEFCSGILSESWFYLGQIFPMLLYFASSCCRISDITCSNYEEWGQIFLLFSTLFMGPICSCVYINMNFCDVCYAYTACMP